MAGFIGRPKLRRFGGIIVHAYALACLGGVAAAQPVPVATVRATVWRPTIELSATVNADQDATLAAARGGRIIGVLFHSGQSVAAGALLLQLDNGPELEQLALDQARLAQAVRDGARERKLIAIAGASQSALEQAEADEAEALAQVALDRADLAQLQVTAPFAGTLGIRKISVGDYVQQGAPVAEITQVTPLRILFSVPQTEAGGIAVGEAFTLSAATLPGAEITAAGKIAALSPMVDAATNARDAEGAVTQNEAALLPGMIGTLTIEAGTPAPAYLVPTTALNDSVLGRYLFLVRPDGKGDTLHTVYVTQYGLAGDDTVIATAGLNPGDRVVSIGGFKLTDGAGVTVENP